MSTALLDIPFTKTAAQIEVDRADINFGPAGPGRVNIQVRFRNTGGSRSAASLARLAVAPLGAFVPWRPIGVMAVPAIEPGRSVIVQTEAVRAQRRPLGSPNRVPPQTILTALGAGDPDDPVRPRGGAAAMVAWLANFTGRARPKEAGTPDTATLPPDPLELIGRTNPYWAGNLNVFVGNREVERHMAQALRVYPGRLNMAMFVVGTWPDSYAFHITGDGSGWDARLYDIMVRHTLDLAVCPRDAIPQRTVVNLRGGHLMMLSFEPPADCGTGSIQVHVAQRSTGREAVVEFSLDPRAAGPGCYVA